MHSIIAAMVEVFAYRHLLQQLVLRDIRIRYKQAVMGFGWAVLMPMLIVLSGIVVRLAMAQLSRTPLELSDIGGVAVRAVPWAFFVGAIGFANISLVGNANLVTKIYFPREVLPLAAVLAQGFDSVIGFLALALLLPFLGMSLSPALLWVPVLALLLLVITAAAALFLSCANLFFRDVKYIVQAVLTFGIFFTPVFFEPAMFGAKGAGIMMLNPLAPVLEAFRLTIIEGHDLLSRMVQGDVVVWSRWYLAYSALWAFGGLALAVALFDRLERTFAEYV